RDALAAGQRPSRRLPAGGPALHPSARPTPLLRHGCVKLALLLTRTRRQPPAQAEPTAVPQSPLARSPPACPSLPPSLPSCRGGFAGLASLSRLPGATAGATSLVSWMRRALTSGRANSRRYGLLGSAKGRRTAACSSGGAGVSRRLK